MAPIEIIALFSVFIIYTASQHLLNWWWRIEDPKEPYESKLVLVMLTLVVTNILFILFAVWSIRNI